MCLFWFRDTDGHQHDRALREHPAVWGPVGPCGSHGSNFRAEGSYNKVVKNLLNGRKPCKTLFKRLHELMMITMFLYWSKIRDGILVPPDPARLRIRSSPAPSPQHFSAARSASATSSTTTASSWTTAWSTTTPSTACWTVTTQFSNFRRSAARAA